MQGEEDLLGEAERGGLNGRVGGGDGVFKSFCGQVQGFVSGFVGDWNFLSECGV